MGFDYKSILNILRRRIMNQHHVGGSAKAQQQFEVEMGLIGGAHYTSCSNTSIIHFSFNKAATQYVKSILVKLAVENCLTPVGINDYAFNSDFPFLDHLSVEQMKQYEHIFKNQGYLYSVFGGMVEGIRDLEKYKLVFSVRDPRDMLVSSYYSQAFSHASPDIKGNKHDGFMERRQLALNSTIDDYVLKEADNINRTFQRYDDLLISRYASFLHLIRYEDMVEDFASWLSGLIEYCEFKVSDESVATLITENVRMKPQGEDIQKHLRKGLPGDYKEKLLPATICSLNNTFSVMLKRFGYSV